MSDRSGPTAILGRRTLRIALDAALLVGFIAEFATREGPDYSLHSWIGVALLPVIGFHLAGNWRWVTSAARRRATHPEWALARFNAVFSVVTAICLSTGFPIWLEWSDASVWSAVHNITGLVSIVMALSHLWRNRRRVTLLIRRPA